MSRALRALSSTYVERRNKIADGAALSGAGKRAAFALFYAPLHFLVVRHITQSAVSSPQSAVGSRAMVVDLGCGTGAAGAAVAGAISATRILGVDRNAWALGEAARTYRAFGFGSQMRQGDVATLQLPKDRAVFVAAFTMNELPEPAREALLERLVDRATAKGDSVLIVEPLAKSAARWWDKWQTVFERAGGRANEWRFDAELPDIVAKLDRAAGLNHRQLTGRSLWIGSEVA